MSAETLATILVMCAMYWLGLAIGCAQGRAQAKREAVPPLHLMLELDGEVIGGLAIRGIRPGHGWDDIETSPTPGHPEAG